MKRIYKFFAVVVALMICGIHIPTETCNALTPIEIAEIYGMIGDQVTALENRISEENDKVGLPMTIKEKDHTFVETLYVDAAAYWYVNNNCDGLRADLDVIRNRIAAIEGGVGASSADVSEIKDGVNNTNAKLDEVQNAVNNIDVQKELEDLGDKIVAEDDGTVAGRIYSMTGFVITAGNEMWKSVKNSIQAFGTEKSDVFFIDPNDYIGGNPVYESLKTLAYSIVLLFFAVQLIETTVKYEMLSLKSTIMIVVRIAIAKTLIDKSGVICIKIYDAVLEEANKVLEASGDLLSSLNVGFDTFFYKSNVKIIGPIIDVIFAIIVMLLTIPLAVIVLLVAAAVMVKLSLCVFEIIALVVTSPVFIACWSSESTKQYARNFIITFIQVTAEVLYMAIVFSIGAKALSMTGMSVTSWEECLLWILSLLPQLIAYIAWGIMIIKPPKSLKNLVH